jgi:hypothetical protein
MVPIPSQALPPISGKNSQDGPAWISETDELGRLGFLAGRGGRKDQQGAVGRGTRSPSLSRRALLGWIHDACVPLRE